MTTFQMRGEEAERIQCDRYEWQMSCRDILSAVAVWAIVVMS